MAVDRYSKPISPVRRRGWHRIGSQPAIEVAPSTDHVTVLGAVTHDGRSFYCWTEEYLTADHGVRFLEALEAEFGETLVVLIERAGYFNEIGGNPLVRVMFDTFCRESFEKW